MLLLSQTIEIWCIMYFQLLNNFDRIMYCAEDIKNLVKHL